jgi:hypothetical protein
MQILEDDFENAEYDHDLIVLLAVLRKINLPQFVSDLKTNDKELFYNLKKLLNKESI